MAFSYTQAFVKTEVGASQTTAAKALTSNPTAGNVVVAILLWFSGGTTPGASFQDGNGNAFTLATSSPSNARATTAGTVDLAFLIAPANAEKTITATFNSTGGGGIATLWVGEFGVSGGTASRDTDASGTGSSGTALNTPTLANAASSLLVVAAVSDHQVSTVDSPWTQDQAGAGTNQFSEGIGHILSGSANQVVAMTQNVSSGWDSLAIAFSFTATPVVPSKFVASQGRPAAFRPMGDAFSSGKKFGGGWR